MILDLVPHISGPSMGPLIFNNGACARMHQFIHQMQYFHLLGYLIWSYDAIGCGPQPNREGPICTRPMRCTRTLFPLLITALSGTAEWSALSVIQLEGPWWCDSRGINQKLHNVGNLPHEEVLKWFNHSQTQVARHLSPAERSLF
jgi:hypothetical protein